MRSAKVVVAVLIFTQAGVSSSFGRDTGKVGAKPWSRPYLAPAASTVLIPLTVPLDLVRDRLLKGLPAPLSEGSNRIGLDWSKAVTIKVIKDVLEPHIEFNTNPFKGP